MPQFRPKRSISALLALVLVCIFATDLAATCRVPFWRETKILDIYPTELAAADLNGDHRPDVIAASATALWVALNTTSGFGPLVPPPVLSGTFASGLAVSDFDGDGDADIVVADKLIPGIMTLRNNGDGTFAAPVVSQITLTPTRIASGDFDGDGKQDIILYASSNLTLAAYTGNGDGTFTQKASTTIATELASLAAGDLDNDGHLDVVVSHTASPMLDVFFGNATATFDPAAPVTGRVYATYTAIADMSHAGYRDIVAANPSDLTVSILRNLSGRLFGYPLTWTNASAQGMNVADFNADGNLDVVVTYTNGIRTYRGWGDGTLSNGFTRASAEYPYATYYTGIASADFDGDGRRDLLDVMLPGQYYARAIWLATNLCGDSTVTASVPSPLISSGQPATIKVRVGPPATESTYPTVTGAVTLREGEAIVGTQDVTSAGDAVFSVPGLGLGEHTFIGSYAGDDQYAAGQSAPVVQRVGSETSTLTMTVTPESGMYGVTACFLPKVTTSQGDQATGSVSLTFDGGAPVSTSIGSYYTYCYERLLGLGDHSVVAQYLGDATHAKSDPITLNYRVEKATTVVSITPAAATAGSPVSLQVTLRLPQSFAYGAAFPTGTVTVAEGSRLLATNLLTGSWSSYYGYTFTIDTTGFTAGIHQLRVTYAGDDHFLPVDTYVPFLAMAPGVTSLDARGTAAMIRVAYSYPEGTSYPTYQVVSYLPGGAVGNYTYVYSGTGVWEDTSAQPKTVYVYRGRKFSDYSPIGPADLGVRISFTDDPVMPGTVIKAVHLTEIVEAVNLVRQAAGLGDVNVPGLTAGSMITAAQVNALRSAIIEARTKLGVTPAVFSDTIVAGETVIRASHIQELREAVR